jgi:hypothetical protein
MCQWVSSIVELGYSRAGRPTTDDRLRLVTVALSSGLSVTTTTWVLSKEPLQQVQQQQKGTGHNMSRAREQEHQWREVHGKAAKQHRSLGKQEENNRSYTRELIRCSPLTYRVSLGY